MDHAYMNGSDPYRTPELVWALRKAIEESGEALPDAQRAILEDFARFIASRFGIRDPLRLDTPYYARYLTHRFPPGTDRDGSGEVRVALARLGRILDRNSSPSSSRAFVGQAVEASGAALPIPFRNVIVDFGRWLAARRVAGFGALEFEGFLVSLMRRGDTVESITLARSALAEFARTRQAGRLSTALEFAWQRLGRLTRLARVGDCWIAEPHSAAAEAAPERAGFLRHGEPPCAGSCAACRAGIASGVWWTTDPRIASRVSYQTDPRTHFRLMDDVRKADRESLALSRAMSATIEVPAPAGLRYLGFQKVAIAYAAGRRGTLLADEMGLGKTVEALGIVNGDPSIENVLVVCPPTLRVNWAREAERWLVRPRSIQVIDGNDPLGEDVGVAIVSYARLPGRWRKTLAARRWDLLIADEAHYVKNPRSERTKALLGGPEGPGVISSAAKLLFLTGTPILNRLTELYTLLAALDPRGGWGGRAEFLARYEDPRSHETLQRKLRERVMVRRLKKDVLPELPRKRWSVIRLPKEVAAEAVSREREILARQVEEVEAIEREVARLSSAGDAGAYRQAVARLREAKFRAGNNIFHARHDVAVAKLPVVIAHTKKILEEGVKKLVIWAHHRDIVSAIADAHGAEAVVLNGDTPRSSKHGPADRFQQDPTIRVFVGSILACGEGLTLTAAAHMVFAELDWSPLRLKQAEDRCHRIGQKESLLIEHLLVEESLDAQMAKMLVAKEELIRGVLDSSAEEMVQKEVESALDLALRLGREAA